MPRLPKTTPTKSELRDEDDAWLESRSKKDRPTWKRVKVVRKLGDWHILDKHGRVMTVMKRVLVHVVGEKTPRTIDLDRLRAGRPHDTHGPSE